MKYLIKLQKTQKLHNITIQKQLKISMIRKLVNIHPEERQKTIDDLSIIMEYQKTINFLDNTQNQPSKFQSNICVEINDDARGVYNPIVKLNLGWICIC